MTKAKRSQREKTSKQAEQSESGRSRQIEMNGVHELKVKGIVNRHWDGEALCKAA